MAAQLGAEIFARGFRFAPTPLEVATYYLPRLVAGAPLHDAVRPVVHHADVYACEPGNLAARFRPLPVTGDRFFFTSCKKGTRVAGPGSWNLQSSRAVMGGADQAEVVGEIKKFKYKKGGAFTDWLMDEFSSTCCSEDPAAGDRRFVLCKIYVSPRALANSAARRESAAFFAQHAPASAVEMTQPAPKRPAPPQVPGPPCPKRMRVAVSTDIPPTMQPAGCTASFAPPRPYVPQNTASAQPLPPVPTFAAPPRHSPEPAAPPCPLAQMPPPIPLPPMVRACHMPVQAPSHQYQPQPPVQTKQSTRDPFEAADLGLGDEAEKESVAAPDPAPELDIDGICRALEEAGELVRLFEDEDTVPTAEAEEAAANSEVSMMVDGVPAPASKEPPAALPQCLDLDEIMPLPDAFFEYFKEFPVDAAEAFKVPQEAIQVT
jgi:hypothetical protein